MLQKFTKLALRHARCCLGYGDSQSARQIMSLFLGSKPSASLYRPTFSDIGDAQFYYGLSMVTDGAENAAAFSFF